MDKKKISKDKLRTFDSDITSILSKQQLQSYDENIATSIEKYYNNRILALEAGHKIAELEIYLRNKMDFCLRELIGEDWIKNSKVLSSVKPKSHIPLEELEHDQILSSLMLGEIIDLIQKYEILHYMLDLSSLDFKKYHQGNRNFFYSNGKKNKFSNISKVRIALNLIRNIRNRAFHWENLGKTRQNSGISYPRITHKEEGTIIGIMPQNILIFLDDLIDIIDNPEMKGYKNIKVKYV